MSLIQAVVTALLSGLFSSAFLFGLGERRERLERRQAKLEEVGLLYVEWCSSLRIYYMRIHELASGRIQIDDMLSNDDKAWNQIMASQAKMELLNGVNEARLDAHIEIVKREARVAHTLYMDMKRMKVEQGSISLDMLNSLSAPLLNIVQSEISGLDVVIASARSIASRPYTLAKTSAWWAALSRRRREG